MYVESYQWQIGLEWIWSLPLAPCGFDTPYLSLPPLVIATMIPCTWGLSASGKLLQTVVAQQAAYSYSRDRIHSTPRPSRSYSRHIDEPAVSSSERHRNQPRRPDPPRDGNDAQVLVDQGRARWYVSNVSIIFDFSILLYYPFWMFMGFILHIYIIFWTNLLTGGPHPYCCFFCLFQYFEEKEYQTESKRNETFRSVIFGTNVIRRTWSASQEAAEAPTR